MDEQILLAIRNSDIESIQDFLTVIQAESIYKLIIAFGGSQLIIPRTYNEKYKGTQSLKITIGEDEARKLITTYSLCQIYIPKLDRIISKIRDENIYKEYYSGCSYNQLAQRYNMATRSIRNIIDKINGGKR